MADDGENQMGRRKPTRDGVDGEKNERGIAREKGNRLAAVKSERENFNHTIKSKFLIWI